MNLLNLEQRGNPIQYQRQNITNELAECREKRLFNQCQYQKENIKNESADHIRQDCINIRMRKMHMVQA